LKNKAPNVRFFWIHEGFTELNDWPTGLQGPGFLWVTTGRREFELHQAAIQHHLHALAGGSLVDLHVTDLLNPQVPSQFDYTSWYDLMVFRRLAPGTGTEHLFLDDAHGTASTARQALAAIDTSPVGFAIFDKLLLTVHPAECTVQDFFVNRLSQINAAPSAPRPSAGAPEGLPPNATEDDAHLSAAPHLQQLDDANGAGDGGHGAYRASASRMPTSPADLMLRVVNHMVDSYLDLRRLLTRQFGHLQQELLSNKQRFHSWQALLDSRNALHLLEDTCEDQRSAVQEWIDALDEWPTPADPLAARDRELLRVRSRDVHEHIERVLGHVRRLESSAESAMQMHFSLQGSRTNDIMRTLTVLTAVFLPLNLITGIFGMNFDALPLIHTQTGFWVAAGLMSSVVVSLLWWFRRQRYLGD
jgi:magnesium transporter